MRTLIVIPTYDERKNIEALIPKILDLSPEIEVLVVDDGSPDGTGDFVEEMTRSNSRVHIIRRRGKMFLTNVNATSVADTEYFFGVPGDVAFGGDPDGDGNLSDSHFYVDNPDPNVVPGVVYPYPPYGGVSINNINYQRTDGIDKMHFNNIPGLGRALKFTFTLFDSRGLIKDGMTFTHIVYLDD